MATIHGDAPANTNLELVLDASSLHLLGTSEAGTGKTLDFAKNANVSISWCRQLREEEETTYNFTAPTAFSTTAKCAYTPWTI